MTERKFAMVGYYPIEVSGHTYAVGSNEGVTINQACERASEEGLEMFQLFPIRSEETGDHRFYRRQEDGEYKRGRSREFAVRLSPEYVGGLVKKDERERQS